MTFQNKKIIGEGIDSERPFNRYMVIFEDGTYGRATKKVDTEWRNGKNYWLEGFENVNGKFQQTYIAEVKKESNLFEKLKSLEEKGEI